MNAPMLLFVALFAAGGAAVARADVAAWPSHPVRLIVPGAGGVLDVRARWLAEHLGPVIGQTVIVEARPGAGGNIGMEAAAHSPADGYTLVMIHKGTMTVNPHIYARPGYDALKDFIPITQVGIGPLLVAVHPGVPARSIGGLIELARAHPGTLSFGSPGIGTPPHVAGELFRKTAGIDVLHVAYKGGGQGITDLIGGHITFTIDGLTALLPHVQAGRLRALAVTGAHRLPSLPDVPTIAESLPGYDYEGWIGVGVPARTPAPIVARLYEAIASVMRSDDAKDWFGQAGARTTTDAPDMFAVSIRREFVMWGKLLREAGIKAE